MLHAGGQADAPCEVHEVSQPSPTGMDAHRESPRNGSRNGARNHPRAEIEVRLAFTIKRGDHLHDILELLIAQFRKDRKGQDFLSRSLRLREGTFGYPRSR